MSDLKLTAEERDIWINEYHRIEDPHAPLDPAYFADRLIEKLRARLAPAEPVATTVHDADNASRKPAGSPMRDARAIADSLQPVWDALTKARNFAAREEAPDIIAACDAAVDSLDAHCGRMADSLPPPAATPSLLDAAKGVICSVAASGPDTLVVSGESYRALRAALAREEAAPKKPVGELIAKWQARAEKAEAFAADINRQRDAAVRERDDARAARDAATRDLAACREQVRAAEEMSKAHLSCESYALKRLHEERAAHDKTIADRDALRAQLTEAERERDLLRVAPIPDTAEVAALKAKLTAAEAERDRLAKEVAALKAAPPLAAVVKRALVRADNTLSVAGFRIDYDTRQKINTALAALDAAPPPCGCKRCTCEDPDRCHGCGARFCEKHAATPAAQVVEAAGLSFAALRDANDRRAKLWNSSGTPVPLIFSLVELAGEAGEACNIGKKIARTELGLAGGTTDMQPLRDEIADVVICADLVARKAGFDLGAAVAAKFNATSNKRGFDVKLPEVDAYLAAKGEVRK